MEWPKLDFLPAWAINYFKNILILLHGIWSQTIYCLAGRK
ncbi:hypothetical protein Cabys_496 [Caldithrix abyssi DSM 13497]|uniref:Uncharacterized protein n=1 Tax=Caldithrix abyssi DSM 13497 TaxID=880073 RepID=A0A1J1C3M0_CALAY|nr:hypothetical protein Cabys_496 [Caldithrix abyssi DSM 13497]